MPDKWLDTGCGTGNFIVKANEFFKDTKFVLADPSNEMLNISKEKLGKIDGLKIEAFETLGTQDLLSYSKEFDVITAIQAHHYLDTEGRKAATENCFRMLKDGGVYITFENIRPLSVTGTEVGLERWRQFQRLNGKSEEEAKKHVDRFGKEFFPITIEDHLQLLRKSGFSTVEVFWFSYMQAGFYAIKN
jgi:tRNA (cmo5U34)-methyltransferase